MRLCDSAAAAAAASTRSVPVAIIQKQQHSHVKCKRNHSSADWPSATETTVWGLDRDGTRAKDRAGERGRAWANKRPGVEPQTEPGQRAAATSADRQRASEG